MYQVFCNTFRNIVPFLVLLCRVIVKLIFNMKREFKYNTSAFQSIIYHRVMFRFLKYSSNAKLLKNLPYYHDHNLIFIMCINLKCSRNVKLSKLC